MKFLFGDIVVVEGNLIGVVVKSWQTDINAKTIPTNIYEVYVREFNAIVEYKENQIDRYRVRHKYLNEEEMKYQMGNNL